MTTSVLTLEKVPQRVVALNGANIVAQAMRQMNPDMVAAYPITPQTLIVEFFSEFVANGEVDTEFVTVESEHSAMSACIGGAAAGGRVQTATSSAGLAFMWELLTVASGLRLPIVMHFVNRALSAPINIHCDHSDSMGARDSGWVQLYAENVQEAYDNTLQSVRIAEHPEVMLPVLHCQDGFILSHGVERAEILPDEATKAFVGVYKPKFSLIDPAHPVTYGPMDLPDYYMEHKRQQVEAMENALEVVPQIGEEYGKLSGRFYGLEEEYRLDDADVAVVAMGSVVGTAREAVDNMRARGVAAGLLKIRCFRPFPSEAVAKALQGKKAVGVMDRAISFGAQGNPLFLEVCTSLFTYGLVSKVLNYVYGLGGRDTVAREIEDVFGELERVAKGADLLPLVRYIGLRE